MASFCSQCGTQSGGRFCPKCGAATASSAAPATGPVPPPITSSPPGAGTSSATKIILIVVALVVLFGAVGVAGIIYVGYRAKQKIAELKQEYGVTPETSSSGSTTSARVFSASSGNGCRMLEGKEAAGILGVAVDRVEYAEDGPDGSEWCRYWINASERKRLATAEILSGINAAGKGNDKDAAAGAEKLIGGALGALVDANGDNKDADFAFSIQVWHSGGQAKWNEIESAKSEVKGITGVDLAALTTQQVSGVGDRALILPAGHSIMVLKGDTFFLLGFQQFVPGKEKTTELARVVAGRI